MSYGAAIKSLREPLGVCSPKTSINAGVAETLGIDSFRPPTDKTYLGSRVLSTFTQFGAATPSKCNSVHDSGGADQRFRI